MDAKVREDAKQLAEDTWWATEQCRAARREFWAAADRMHHAIRQAQSELTELKLSAESTRGNSRDDERS